MGIRDLFTKDDERDSGIHDIVGDSGVDVSETNTQADKYAREFEAQDNSDLSKDLDADLNYVAKLQEQNLTSFELNEAYKLVVRQGIGENPSLSEEIAYNICKYYTTGNIKSLINASALSQHLPAVQGPTLEADVPVANIIRKEMLNASIQIYQNLNLDPEERIQMKEMLLEHYNVTQEQEPNPVDKMQMLIIQELAGDKNIELDKEYKKILFANPEMVPELMVFGNYVADKKAEVINKQRKRQQSKTYGFGPTPSMPR